MIWVVWSNTMQFIQQILRNQLRLGVLHTMHYPVAYSFDQSKSVLFFEPINQEICRRLMIRSSKFAAALMKCDRVIKSQNRLAQTNPVNLSTKPSLHGFAAMKQSEPDAGRTTIDRQNAGFG